MKAIIVGAGGATRELLRRLGDSWTVTVIDVSEEQLQKLRETEGAHTVAGDGTSRLTLQRAGLAPPWAMPVPPPTCRRHWFDSRGDD